MAGRRSPAGTGRARNTTTGTSIAIVASAAALLLTGADLGGINRRVVRRVLGYKSAALLAKLLTATRSQPASE